MPSKKQRTAAAVEKTLSMIAREITGMRWSGPLFFGLRPPANAKTKPSTKKRGGR